MIQKILIPVGASLFSAGVSGGSIFLFKNKAERKEEHPNVVTFYKKKESGYLTLGNDIYGRWVNPDSENVVSLGEKGWQYEETKNNKQSHEDYFQLKGRGKQTNSNRKILANHKDLESDSLNGSITVSISGTSCKDINEKFLTVDQKTQEKFKLNDKSHQMKIFDNNSFVFWNCQEGVRAMETQ